MEHKNVGLLSPWMLYLHTLEAMFKEDSEISVAFDNENFEIKLRVNSSEKADALEKLLPKEKTFGDRKLKITVIPGNVKEESKAELLKKALKGNSAVKDIIEIGGVFTNPMWYIVFKKDVVQYYADNLGDPHGNRSTLYEVIANEIFGEGTGIFYCTDIY